MKQIIILQTGTGQISSTPLIIILSIAIFIFFLFKINKKKNEKNSFRNSLFMTLIGIVVLILSATINTNGNEAASHGKTILLLIGAIYTLYGGYYAINKFTKRNNNEQ